MNSRERFQKSIAHELPDRLPVDLLWPRAETIAQLKEHFQTDSNETMLRNLGVDLRWMGVNERYPEFEKSVNGELTGNAPGAGKKYIFHDKQTFEDHWGIMHRVGDDGKYLEWKGGPLVGRETLEGWDVPAVEYPSLEAIRKRLQPFNEYVTITELEFPFKLAWHICGYEHFMYLMALNPGMVSELYDRIYAFQTRKAVLCAQAGFDVIAVVGDIAGQNGMLFSPDMFAEFDVPRFSKLIREVKAVNPAVKVFYHSDGNMEAVIPHLVTCGIDILNPIQSACMDPANIKEKYGKVLSFHGTISVQDTLPHGTVDDVRREVIARIETVGYNGGFVVSPENSIPYDAPLENVLALYETVRDYDYRKLAAQM